MKTSSNQMSYKRLMELIPVRLIDDSLSADTESDAVFVIYLLMFPDLQLHGAMSLQRDRVKKFGFIFQPTVEL